MPGDVDERDYAQPTDKGKENAPPPVAPRSGHKKKSTKTGPDVAKKLPDGTTHDIWMYSMISDSTHAL